MISYNSTNNNVPHVISEGCITIGRMAPDFMALSTKGYIRLSDYRGKWVIFISQPTAFASVATTEIIATALIYAELLKRNVEMICLTTDNIYANLAWVYDIYQKTGVEIPFPIITDADLRISEQYGMLNPDRMYEESVRSAFVINPNGRIKAVLTLPTSCGRNGEELLRVLESLQITEKYNLYTPANWQPGDQVLIPTPTNYDDLVTRIGNAENSNIQCPFWYVCYTDLPTEKIE